MPAHRILAVAITMQAALAACSSSSTGNPEPEPEAEPDVAPDFERTAMLTHLVDEVVLPLYEQGRADLAALRDATYAWRDASGDGVAERTAAQDLWRVAFTTWTEADVMQIGPAGAADVTKNGQGLRDDIYAWPSTSPCSIDQALVANTFEDSGYFASKLVNMRGLGGMEVALFSTTGANACPVAAAINTNGSWAALGDVEVQARRARYAAALGDFLVGRADALLAAWSDGHRADFIAESGGVYGSQGAAVDELVAAMLYVDKTTKDLKLGIPLGVNDLCPTETCPGSFESQQARAMREGILGNLRGLKAIVDGERPGGASGLGLFDYLVAAEATIIADALVAHLDAAIAEAEAAPPDFIASIDSDREALLALHALVGEVDSVIKTEVITALEIELPSNTPIDTD